MHLMTAPALVERCDIFLAGGISNCPDWQAEAIKHLDHTGLYVANPRRPTGLEKTGKQASAQIAWERLALDKAKVTLFWFPKESICPITLFELGMALGRGKKIVVGVHPEYPRRFDVEEQCVLSGHDTFYLNVRATVAEAVRLARMS